MLPLLSHNDSKSFVHCLHFLICAPQFHEQGCWLDFAQMVVMRLSVVPYHSSIFAWHIYFGYRSYAVQAQSELLWHHPYEENHPKFLHL